jgi:hypothetical protein
MKSNKEIITNFYLKMMQIAAGLNVKLILNDYVYSADIKHSQVIIHFQSGTTPRGHSSILNVANL